MNLKKVSCFFAIKEGAIFLDNAAEEIQISLVLETTNAHSQLRAAQNKN